jgi:hypothetical protein
MRQQLIDVLGADMAGSIKTHVVHGHAAAVPTSAAFTSAPAPVEP